ncbi:MAG TPA: phosphatidylserine decarboxylase family protein, partial [Xanthobacteraceae bacterium]
MSVLASVRSQLVPIHREGYPFIIAFVILALILFFIWQPLGWI